MDYVVPKGIPHSQFLEWPESDQDKALAWESEQNELCPGCGTRDSDWRDEEKRILIPPPFDVVDRRCAGCQMKEEHRTQLIEEQKADPTGLYVHLTRHDPSNDDEAED